MSHNLLFRHHAGRMPGPARWYLAIVMMLSLMFLAAHFAVQAHAQKVMQRAVQAQLDLMEGKISQVRYRLLRGALTIDGLQIQQEQWAINISHIYLQISTSAMLSESSRAPRVRFDGMNLSVPRADLIRWFQSASPNVMTEWLAVMNHSDELILTNGKVRLTDEKNHWQVTKVSGKMSAGGFDFSGNSSGSLIRLHGERKQSSFSGGMIWKDMAAARLAHILGLKAKLHGSSSGLLNWQADWPHRNVRFDGDIHLVDQPAPGDIHIQGKTGPDSIQIQTRCRDVSLAGLGGALPAVDGRLVQAGIWSGDVQFRRQGKNQPHIMNMSGEARSVTLVSGDFPVWTIGSITLNNAVAQWPAHRINVEHVRIRNMDMALTPEAIQSPASPWDFQVDNLTFENVRPSIAIRGDSSRLLLPPMDGDGHLEGNGYMELNAASEGDEAWHITGTGHVERLFNVNISAKKVPLARLRPLLPDVSLPGGSGALQLSGNSKFRISLQTGNDELVLKGQTTLTDVMVSQGGDAFLADAIHIDIQQAGMLKMQQLGLIRIDQWRYQSALHPIPRTVEAKAIQEAGPQQGESSWQVDELIGNDGVISVGSEDAVWADHASFSLKKLRAGTWSPLVFHASVGGGSLRIRGHADLFSADPRMKLNVRLTDAVPFFLNNWLMVSGSPRLIRGRLDGSLSIKPARGEQTYMGVLKVVLHQGQFESGAFPQDPMLPLTGYNMQALSERLGKRGRLKMEIPFRGDWHAQPFSINNLGAATLKVIKRRAASTKGIQRRVSPASKTVSHIRLQHGRAFSHNEHVRLWQVVKALWKQPKLIVELLPQLGRSPLDEGLTSRIRYTQAMIEHYMHTRGIAKHRIYPVWPTTEHRHGDTTGIKITARMP